MSSHSPCDELFENVLRRTRRSWTHISLLPGSQLYRPAQSPLQLLNRNSLSSMIRFFIHVAVMPWPPLELLVTSRSVMPLAIATNGAPGFGLRVPNAATPIQLLNSKVVFSRRTFLLFCSLTAAELPFIRELAWTNVSPRRTKLPLDSAWNRNVDPSSSSGSPAGIDSGSVRTRAPRNVVENVAFTQSSAAAPNGTT